MERVLGLDEIREEVGSGIYNTWLSQADNHYDHTARVSKNGVDSKNRPRESRAHYRAAFIQESFAQWKLAEQYVKSPERPQESALAK